MRHILVPIALFTMITVITVGRPLIRAWAKRIEGNATPDPLGGEAQARLERMELAIEAMALEVERIAEGQRFTTKLLAERGADAQRADAVRLDALRPAAAANGRGNGA